MTFMEYVVLFIPCFIRLIESGSIEPDRIATTENTRRILHGAEVFDTRPYMVYLRPAQVGDNKKQIDPNWLCGGVIIHERYVITSASCIEEIKHFYVISGTNKWLPLTETNDCISFGAKRAVWKCVPKDYVFDGREFDNIRWMAGDIAIVKVADDFNFQKRIKGCEFIPKKALYNNETEKYEEQGIVASTAGWGTTDVFGNRFNPLERQATINSPILMESDVVLISKRNCKKRWEPRYHQIIDQHMICAMDSNIIDATVCLDHEVECQELVNENIAGDYDETQRRALWPTEKFMTNPKTLLLHSAGHHNSNLTNQTRRKLESGGFCENDHGGPLMYGQGPGAIVIGIISACLMRPSTRKCYGPFLFTSVYKYRNVIACAIHKDTIGPETCRKLLRTSKTRLEETTMDWNNISPVPKEENTTSTLPGDTDNLGSLRYFIDKSMNTNNTQKQADNAKKSTIKRRHFWTQRGSFQEKHVTKDPTVGLGSTVGNRGPDYDLA